MKLSAPVILYAEDSDDDAFLMRRAFSKLNFLGSLVVVPNGLSAINYLSAERSESDGASPPPPQLILLDLKMPQMGGIEVLKWIRSGQAWNNTRVIMLTSSSQKTDIETAFNLGADSYLLKPTNLHAFRELVEDLINLCASPGRSPGPLPIRGAIHRGPAQA